MRLHTLYESAELPRFDMPAVLERVYGGFGLPDQVVYANFVSSVDGIVAIPGEPRSSALISGGFEGDRFVVALLRAVADAVVIGAGTFRQHRGPWTAAAAHAELTDAFATLRSGVASTSAPQLVVITASGDVGGPTSKLQDVIIATTDEGARRVPSDAHDVRAIETIGSGNRVDVRDAVSWLRRQGHRRILTEGGPRLMGEMLEADVIDELFLTVSPLLAGSGRSQERPVLSAGATLLPDAPMWGDVRSVRRAGDYLFLRYGLRAG